MAQQGRYGPADVQAGTGTYKPSDVLRVETPPPSETERPPGDTFWEQFLGVPHPLENIGETSSMAVNQPRKLLSGAWDFLGQSPVGVVRAVKPLLKAAAYMTPPGMAYAGATKGAGLPSLEDVTSIGGGKSFAKAGELVGAGRYREAAEAATAGVLQAASLALPSLLKPKAQTLTKLRGVSEGVTLPTGEKLPMTLGMQQPSGVTATVEKIAGQLIGGGKLRATRQAEAADAAQVMKGIAERTAAQARVAPVGLPQGISASFKIVADSVRKAASPLYEQVKAAMREPEAVQPVIEHVAEAADKLRSDVQLSKVLVKAGDARPAIEQSLNRIAAFKGGVVPPESTALVLDAPSVFDLFDSARSGLSAIKRIPSLTRTEHRIVSGVVRELDAAMDKGLEASDAALGAKAGEGLRETYRRGASLTAQGYALEDVADALEKATKGTPVEVQAGVKELLPRAEQIGGSRLVQSLRALSETPYSGGPSRLKIALPAATDEAALRQVAEYLSRSERLGGESLAAKFGVLAAVSAVGGLSAGALTGFYLGRPITGVIAGLSPEVGAWLISRALTSKVGPRLVADFLRAAPQSAAEGAVAKQLAVSAQQGQNQPEKH